MMKRLFLSSAILLALCVPSFATCLSGASPAGTATLKDAAGSPNTFTSPYIDDGNGNCIPQVLAIPSSTNLSSIASWTTATSLNTTATITASAGNYANIQLTVTGTANVTAGAITVRGEAADGTFQNMLAAQILGNQTLAPVSANPIILTSVTQHFLIPTAGYQNIQVKLTTAITTSSGAGTTVIAATLIPTDVITPMAMLNPIIWPVTTPPVIAQNQTNLTPTDCSGTIGTGDTAQNAIAAQTTLHGFTLANIDASSGSGEDLWFSFTGTAAAATAGSYALVPIGGTITGPYTWTSPPGFGTGHAVSIVGHTTGHKYSCTWW